MKPAIQRCGRLGFLALALVLPLAGPAACRKGESGAAPPATPPATPPPGADNDGPAVARVPYARLEYNDGSFSLDGKKFTGISEEFHPDGTTLAKLYEYKDGLFDGTTREYYENGQISTSTQWRKGLRHGANMYWNEEGKPTNRQTYEDDVAIETVDLDAAAKPDP